MQTFMLAIYNFLNDSFFLDFPISPENRDLKLQPDLDPIRYGTQ